MRCRLAATSLGVVVENMLKGWVDLGLEDELHLVIRPDVDLDLPVTVTVHHVGQHRLTDRGRSQ